MRIYQPMLFIGLGGTGCRVGAELERTLREELCGPDGTEMQQRLNVLAPYQLPGCLQFVYADLAEEEFGHIEKRAVPDRMYLPAAERTFRMVRDLVPRVDTYPEVAQSLRLSAPVETSAWLPPAQGEPRIGPLSRGAGQLPTIGRAALFETFRGGLAPAKESLEDAIGEINGARGQLAELAGGKLSREQSVDVFVACSVAGGTGSGLFYDYLHLVGSVLNSNGYRARIFPLIVMPSAFPEGLGGGRPARLNAARALLDLFRLVDNQNATSAGNRLNTQGSDGAQEIRYPGRNNVVRLRPSTVQTAVLFGGSKGMQRDDLHRSMVSLVLSLIGTDLTRDAEGASVAPNFQSFADSFINNVDRGVPAPAGVGKRGVSTSSVASLTVPVEELAEIISSRLLADAVIELDQRSPGAAENNREHIKSFFSAANLDRLWSRPVPESEEPPAAVGWDAIHAALNMRSQNHQLALEKQEEDLRTEVPEMARRFDPNKAVREALTGIDLFHVRRVVMGDTSFEDGVSKLGFVRTVQSRRGRPERPEDVEEVPPTPKIEKTRFFGRLRWADPSVRESYDRQTDWFTWQSKVLWHAAWNDQGGRWESRLRTLDRELGRVVKAFVDYAAAEPARFARKEKALYESRVGVSYLLPRQGQLESFYAAVVRRFVNTYHEQGRVLPVATPGDLVNAVLGSTGWRAAYDEAVEYGPERAVVFVRDQILHEVRALFALRDGQSRPLLPRLNELLSAAAGRDTDMVDEDDLRQFKEKLAGLVPGGYAPSGTGTMKILFSYPSARRDQQLESYLQQTVSLPRSVDSVIEWRPLDLEFITAVMFRTSMGLTEVPEVQDILRDWADAVHHPEEGDFLPWRQRLDYRFSYLAANEEDRVRILHHLLCVAWNGGITPYGDRTSPERIDVALNASQVHMQLDLTPYGHQSSWGSILAAYEEWVLADNEPIRRQFAAELVRAMPAGVMSRAKDPHPLFLELVEIAAKEGKAIDQMLNDSHRGRRRLEILHEFWTTTFTAAMQLPFAVNDDVYENTLAQLSERVPRDPQA